MLLIKINNNVFYHQKYLVGHFRWINRFSNYINIFTFTHVNYYRLTKNGISMLTLISGKAGRIANVFYHYMGLL